MQLLWKNKTWSETGRSGISLQLRKPDGPWWKCGGQYLPGRAENIRDHIRKKRKSIIKRYQTKRTVGHTGIARECFAQRGNRTRSPHFKRELSGGSMSLQRSIRTLWPWRQILNASICKQYEDAKIIFQYSLLYRTVVQAIDGTNKKAAAFLLLRQPQKEGIYIVNVFKTKGRDRQNALPVKYEKVYFVPGLLSCYALQDTGKMCRNIVFDVKKLWNRCRIECSPGRKLLFSGMSFLEWKFWRERRRGGSCRSRLINL